MKLITISISHYVEKAKWALDRSGLAFEEECHIPGVHAIATLWATKGRHRATPVLIDAGEVIPDSTAILKHLVRKYDQKWLYPVDIADDVLRFEESFDEKIGPHVRRNVYYKLFQSPYDVAKLFDQVAPTWQRNMLPFFSPLMKQMMIQDMRIYETDAARSREIFEAEFARIENIISDGRRYLMGDRFTAADITFAALTAAAVAPAEYGATLPDLNDPAFSDELRREIESYRARPAGQFALRLYKEERKKRG